MYPEMLVAPMRSELTNQGFTELKTPDDVENQFSNKQGTTLLVFNSVCGCAAGSARPGVVKSLEHALTPDRKLTVFAGMEKDAVNKAREYTLPYPPSSPAIALFKDGELVHFLERHQIEGRTADMISANLKMAYDTYCKQSV